MEANDDPSNQQQPAAPINYYWLTLARELTTICLQHSSVSCVNGSQNNLCHGGLGVWTLLQYELSKLLSLDDQENDTLPSYSYVVIVAGVELG